MQQQQPCSACCAVVVQRERLHSPTDAPSLLNRRAGVNTLRRRVLMRRLPSARSTPAREQSAPTEVSSATLVTGSAAAAASCMTWGGSAGVVARRHGGGLAGLGG